MIIPTHERTFKRNTNKLLALELSTKIFFSMVSSNICQSVRFVSFGGTESNGINKPMITNTAKRNKQAQVYFNALRNLKIGYSFNYLIKVDLSKIKTYYSSVDKFYNFALVSPFLKRISFYNVVFMIIVIIGIIFIAKCVEKEIQRQNQKR